MRIGVPVVRRKRQVPIVFRFLQSDSAHLTLLRMNMNNIRVSTHACYDNLNFDFHFCAKWNAR